MPNLTELHYRGVVREMLQGRVIPFLGAGANMCGRPRDVAWEPGRYLPSGAELAAHLASNFDYPSDELRDLLRVSQYVAVMSGSGPLYEELHELFDVDYPPNSLHQLLVGFPGLVRDHVASSYQLIVTTNYDDALERAFRAAGEEFDCVYYLADGEHRGKFLHFPPDGDGRLIERPNEYRELRPETRTVILKLHGAIDRVNPERDSYVITEDHYIDYLTRTDLSNLVPATLGAKLRRSHFLFLGYSLRDWNLRVILHRIWGTQALTYKSWAIQLDPQPIDEEFWRKRNVDMLYTSLEEYVDTLASRLLAERDRTVSS